MINKYGRFLGLIQVMRNLAELSELGAGIAVAFVATIYGVGMANLMFLPIANKIKNCIANQIHHDEMIVEGLVSMASNTGDGGRQTRDHQQLPSVQC